MVQDQAFSIITWQPQIAHHLSSEDMLDITVDWALVPITRTCTQINWISYMKKCDIWRDINCRHICASDVTYWNYQILYIENCFCTIQADIAIEDNVGYQALHQAAQSGCIESVKFLIDSIGLSPNTISSRGFTPLSVAAKVNIFMDSLKLSSNSVPKCSLCI